MSSSLRFAHAVRSLSEAARLRGLDVPLFRSPPRATVARRTIRYSRRGAIVAVAIVDRPWADVVGDMIDGIVVVNRLAGGDAVRARTGLWSAMESADRQVA